MRRHQASALAPVHIIVKPFVPVTTTLFIPLNTSGMRQLRVTPFSPETWVIPFNATEILHPSNELFVPETTWVSDPT